MGDPAAGRSGAIVDLPITTTPNTGRTSMRCTRSPAARMLMVDNLMDLTHLRTCTPRRSAARTRRTHVEAIMDAQPDENGLQASRAGCSITSGPPTYRKACPHLAERVDRWQEFEFVAPAVVLQWVGAIDAGTGAYDQGKRDGGFSLRIFHALTPETETTCHYFWCGANGYAQDDPQRDRALVRRAADGVRQDQCDRAAAAGAAVRIR